MGKWVQYLMFGCVIALVLVVIAVVMLFGSFMEARAFNRLTGASVSTWDAVWVELRVDVPVKVGQ